MTGGNQVTCGQLISYQFLKHSTYANFEGISERHHSGIAWSVWSKGHERSDAFALMKKGVEHWNCSYFVLWYFFPFVKFYLKEEWGEIGNVL